MRIGALDMPAFGIQGVLRYLAPMPFKERTAVITERVLDVALLVFAAGATLSISLEETAAAIAYFAFGLLWILGRARPGRVPGGWAVGLLLLGGLITAVFRAASPLQALREKFLDFWMIPLFIILPAWLDQGKRKRFLDFLFLGASLAALYGIVQSLTGFQIFSSHRLVRSGNLYHAIGWSGMHLTYGGLMSMVCLVALGAGSDTGSGRWRGFYWLTAGLSGAACMLSFSRSAFTGLVAGFAVFGVLLLFRQKGRQARRRAFVLLLIPIVAGGAVLALPEVHNRMLRFLSVDYMKGDLRYSIWRTSLNMALKNPVWGIGSERDFKRLYPDYQWGRRLYRPMPHAHNDILQSWLTGGLFALAGYLGFFGMLFVVGWKRSREGPLMLGLFAAMVVMFVQGWSQCFFTAAKNGWLFWALAGILIPEQRRVFSSVKGGLLSDGDVLSWDTVNWSGALDFWGARFPRNLDGLRCLEIGAGKGGLSLWFAAQGASVVCTDRENPAGLASPLHLSHGVAERVSYDAVDALALPYEQEFDIVVFKSVLGAIGRAAGEEGMRSVMEGCRRALKPGGVLVFAENLAATKLHSWLRRRFIPWGSSWRYITAREVRGFCSSFSSLEYAVRGFLGALGRSERQRTVLGLADRWVSRLVPAGWRYIIWGVAKK